MSQDEEEVKFDDVQSNIEELLASTIRKMNKEDSEASRKT